MEQVFKLDYSHFPFHRYLVVFHVITLFSTCLWLGWLVVCWHLEVMMGPFPFMISDHLRTRYARCTQDNVTNFSSFLRKDRWSGYWYLCSIIFILLNFDLSFFPSRKEIQWLRILHTINILSHLLSGARMKLPLWQCRQMIISSRK